MHKLTVMVFVWVVVASTASAQSLTVDQYGDLLPKNIDHVGLTLSGFSADASSATVTMIGEHYPGVPEDGPLCRAIEPPIVEVSLLDGGGSAVWTFSNRFDGRYRLRCRIRADDGMGTTAEGHIHSVGGEHRMTLDPAQVAPNATTSVEVAVWIDSGYSDGNKLNYILSHWGTVPVVADCEGVTAAQPTLVRVPSTEPPGLQVRGTWDVMTTDPVECPVRFDDPDFEASATLSVVAGTPPPDPTPTPDLTVDLHRELYGPRLDHVTVTLSGFSPVATSATVEMIGRHADPPQGVLEDEQLCLAIRPLSVNVPLLDGEGSAVWNFSNRFDRRYSLRCLIRADDGMGNTADNQYGIRTVGGEHRITLDPAQVAANATTSVDVAVWIDTRYANGLKVQDIVLPHWRTVPVVVAGCEGVTPAQLTLEPALSPTFGGQLRGTWDVMTTDPVECPVRFDAADFEASATLSVVAAVTVPEAPTGLTLTGGDGALAASWRVPTQDGGSAITGYTVQWRSGDEDWGPWTSEVTSSTNSYEITGLTNGETYTVRVAAVNEVATGAWSAEATAIPGTPVPALPPVAVAMLALLLLAGAVAAVHRSRVLLI